MNHVAVHESAHALGAWALDKEPVRLVLFPNGNGVTLAGVGEVPLTLDEIVAAADRRTLVRDLAIRLAGPVAESMLNGGACDWIHERGVHELAMAAELAPWRLIPRVRTLLEVPTTWGAVHELAGELERTQCVEAARIREILSPHIARGAWLPQLDGVIP